MASDASGYRHRLYDTMFVTYDGRVGIGTSNPTDTLQVAGKANVSELSANAISSLNQTLQLQSSIKFVVRDTSS